MGRHSGRAAVLSALFMGLGQLYNRQWLKGILLALIELAFLIYLLPRAIKDAQGLITLGDTPQLFVDGIFIPGDHSIYMMVFGLITLLNVAIFIAVYAVGIMDARKVGQARDEGHSSNSFMKSLYVLTDKGFPYLMLTPSVALILFITLLPLVFGVLIAFTNYSSPNHLPPRALVDWVGFSNFADLFRLPSLSRTLGGVALWTFVWAILATGGSFLIGMLLALLTNASGIRFKKIWRVIFILPWAMPQFISALIMRNMLNQEFGPINRALDRLGIDPIPWLTDPTMAKISCILVDFWFEFPYYMILITGVLANINKDMYESASLEGAGTFTRFRAITLPMVLQVTFPLIIMGFAFNFNNFTFIYLLTGGEPRNISFSFAGHTDILLSWLYKITLEQNQFHLAATVSILIFLVISAISVVSLRSSKSYQEEDMMR
ncbi:ABC transporter permease subunit [Cohnella faecalis]|uniref:Maltose/maltodextrin transport system permease protein n=1 Tax=Cohnella faecalis TaxID=2315694 RepID=A0A398CD46_9BACL|nr:sugar ABC transporter permease [Cohnella faecalis]RIE01106.1 sugar ABC transporter permease [Cohnella faecalis]